jgi:hypothetical protein
MGAVSVKKSEMAATIEALRKENRELKEQIIMYKRSFEVGDDIYLPIRYPSRMHRNLVL